MTKISKLTNEQQLTLEQFRQRMFDSATSTTTDRPAAETAISTIVAPALAKYEIHWCKTPQEADSLWDSLRASLWDSLWDSLSASLRASLSASLWDSLRDSLRASLWDSLWDSLSASLWDSLSASLRASLRASLWDSLRDSSWTAFYLFPVEIGVVEVDADKAERIKAYAAFGAAAFALWVLPGHVIVLEKPTHVEIKDGKLVGISWGDQ